MESKKLISSSPELHLHLKIFNVHHKIFIFPIHRPAPLPPSSASVSRRSPLPVSTLAASVTLVKSRMNRWRISGRRGRMLSNVLLFAGVGERSRRRC
ncbi:hypothetical protein HanXRQr2_Chr16g0767131 [Helianthus annuus]|uniref:Uncharacterized protein n=1 Tax=Helianthus annuus TaxID=4232 RepID=A0A251S242_HELAN|nr:hypothetical protein HanXRQr2_Chr16g0767131 [Helianthus annuus]KAJ0822713.1 hypothetical protein HanPSC8_Chr16g0735331 [Helianthus annuus]